MTRMALIILMFAASEDEGWQPTNESELARRKNAVANSDRPSSPNRQTINDKNRPSANTLFDAEDRNFGDKSKNVRSGYDVAADEGEARGSRFQSQGRRAVSELESDLHQRRGEPNDELQLDSDIRLDDFALGDQRDASIGFWNPDEILGNSQDSIPRGQFRSALEDEFGITSEEQTGTDARTGPRVRRVQIAPFPEATFEIDLSPDFNHERGFEGQDPNSRRVHENPRAPQQKPGDQFQHEQQERPINEDRLITAQNAPKWSRETYDKYEIQGDYNSRNVTLTNGESVERRNANPNSRQLNHAANAKIAQRTSEKRQPPATPLQNESEANNKTKDDRSESSESEKENAENATSGFQNRINSSSWPFLCASFLLLVSAAFNVWLFWMARDIYRRYQDAVDDLSEFESRDDASIALDNDRFSVASRRPAHA